METDESETVTTNYHRLRERIHDRIPDRTSIRDRLGKRVPPAKTRRKYRIYLTLVLVAVATAIGIGSVLSGLALLLVMSVSQQPLLVIGAGLMVGFGTVLIGGAYIWLTT